MSIEEKANYIDKVLGFYFDEPFLKGAANFPSPEGEVESWYKFSLVFDKVATLGDIPEKDWEILQLFVEDATTEYEAAAFLGEEPDLIRGLGVGYDGYVIPEGFAQNYQKLIWESVLSIYGS
ncbi:MAG: hypothetical protein K6L81_06185 [Agarilytica sp.]